MKRVKEELLKTQMQPDVYKQLQGLKTKQTTSGKEPEYEMKVEEEEEPKQYVEEEVEEEAKQEEPKEDAEEEVAD